MIKPKARDYGLEFLLGFDGREHVFDDGYWVKFDIKEVEKTKERPHGLYYSFTLHAPDGTRLLGFDNAHAVPPTGSKFNKQPVEHDHWHRTETDHGRPYAFQDVVTLLTDFEREVARILGEKKASATLASTREKGKRK
jgi:hypothetical protein